MSAEKKPVNWRLWLAVVLGALLIIVAFQNSERIDVDVLMINLSAPLIVVILASAAIGGVIGWLAPMVRRHRRDEQ